MAGSGAVFESISIIPKCRSAETELTGKPVPETEGFGLVSVSVVPLSVNGDTTENRCGLIDDIG